MTYVVRAVSYEDKARATELLHYVYPHVSVEEWGTALFEYVWKDDPPNYGFLAEDEGKAVGFIGATYTEKWVRGNRITICCPAAWCVHEDWRGRGVGTAVDDALLDFTRREGMVHLALTLAPHLFRYKRGRGFLPFRTFRSVRYPRVPLLKALSGRLPSGVDPATVTSDHVGEAAYKTMKDHEGLACTTHVLRVGDAHCVVLTQARTVEVPRPKWLGGMQNRQGPRGRAALWLDRLRDVLAGRIVTSEILYVSDRSFFREHLDGIALHVLRHQRKLAFSGEEELLGLAGPDQQSRHGDYLYHEDLPPGVTPSDLDPIYSEMLLVPDS